MKAKISRRHLWTLAAAALAAITFASAARADWTLTTADLKDHANIKINTWDLADGLSVTLDSGTLDKIQTRDVLALASSLPRPAAPGEGAPWKLSLRNGDVLYGAPAAIKGQWLQFTVKELGTIAVPLKLVSAIETTAPPKDAATGAPAGGDPADKDVVRFDNNDKKAGLIVDVTGDQLQLAVAADNNAISTIDMSLVERMSFAGVTRPRTIPPLSARIALVSGSVLTVPLDAAKKSFSWTLNEITFKDPAGKERKVQTDAILGVDVTGGRIVGLTELDPVKDLQTTYMGTHWPTQINKNVLGGPLTVAKTVYPRGLGVHTRSDLTYALHGQFDTFKFRVGMDDSAAPQGSADVSVLLDGKVLWQSKGLQSTGDHQLSPELSLPVKGGQLLELRAAPALDGGKIDVLGRVDWLNVALTRP